MLPLVLTIRMLQPSQKSFLKPTKRRNMMINSTIADNHQLPNSIPCRWGQKAQTQRSDHWVPLFPEHDDPNSATDSTDASAALYVCFIPHHHCISTPALLIHCRTASGRLQPSWVGSSLKSGWWWCHNPHNSPAKGGTSWPGLLAFREGVFVLLGNNQHGCKTKEIKHTTKTWLCFQALTDNRLNIAHSQSGKVGNLWFPQHCEPAI